MSDTSHGSAADRALLAPPGSATLMDRVNCLDDTAIYEFVNGDLSGEELVSADAHVDTCLDCRELVIGLAKSEAMHAGQTADNIADRDTTDQNTTNDELGRGAIFGRYIILAPIGHGAMGTVYLAFDAELNRKVALKLLHADAEPARKQLTHERLLREAQAMARLSHPNVVTVYEVGSVEQTVFLAMEYVDGVTLRQWMDQDHSCKEVIETFVQAARGLQAAHEVGLAHRDFKPANVLVGPDGRVRVTDFGLARDLLDELDDDDGDDDDGGRPDERKPTDRLAHTLTATGSLVGTPAYMAPEQFMGMPANAVADQFSFCATLYEALYQERAFTGATIAELHAAANTAETLKQPRGSAVPKWLHSVLVRGLRKKPSLRFSSMTELLGELGRKRGRVRRLSLLALAIVAPAAITVMVLMPSSSATPQLCTASAAQMHDMWNSARKQRIHTAFRNADERYGGTFANAVTDGLTDWSDRWTAMHQGTCRATHVDGNQSEALLDVRMMCLNRQRDRFDAVVSELGRADRVATAQATTALASLPDIQVCADATTLAAITPPPAATIKRVKTLHRGLAHTRALLVTAKLADARRQSAKQVADAVAIDYKPAIAHAKHVRADALARSGDMAQASQLAYQALWAAQEARDDRMVAETWLLLVRIAGESAGYDRAGELANHARAAVKRIGSPKPLMAQLHSSLGLVLHNRGRYAKAEQDFKSALTLRTQLHGNSHPSVAAVLTNLGHVARKQRHYRQALALHRRALKINSTTFGDSHPRIARHHHNIAGILRLQRKYSDASRHYQTALAMKVRLLGPRHHDVALTYNSLGLVLLDTGKLSEARQHFQRALAIFTATKHGQRAIALYNLGVAWQRGNDHSRALYALVEARKIYAQVHGKDHARVARASLAIADSYVALAKPAEARKTLKRVLDHAAGSTLAANDNNLRELVAVARGRLAKLAPDTNVRVRRRVGPKQPPPANVRVHPRDKPKQPPATTPKIRPQGGEYGGGQTWE